MICIVFIFGYFVGNFWGKFVNWLVEDCNCYNWFVFYCEDIVDGVSCCNVVKIERIINDWYKEVGGIDNVGVIVQIVYCCIVMGFIIYK